MKNSIKGLEVHIGEDVKTTDPDSLYKVLENLPKPDVQMKLNDRQKHWWYWFGLEFLQTKQVSKLDLIHLQKASFWMDARCQAMFEINKKGYKGLVQKFQSGATNISGDLSVVEKADKHLDEVSAHFGLSIKDRQKLKVKEIDDGQLSLFEKFMQKKVAE